LARIGQAREALVVARRHGLAWSALAVLVVLPLAIWTHGFAIDDAFIGVRYARHLAEGAGYRFNTDGPSTDGVTPLPWAFLLAPMAHAPALVVLARAKGLGRMAWLAAVAVWGAAIGKAEARIEAKIAALAVLAVCLPTAAHASNGMETSLATLVATVASVLPNPWAACACAGLAASLRPEMVVWGVAFALFAGPAPRATSRALLAAAPFVVCACIRVVAFGRAAPLSLLAKPSDLAHGVSYAVVAGLVSLAPIVVFAPVALLRARGRSAALAVAGLAHLAAIAVAGGDWMPFARLAVPIVPSLLYAFVLASPRMSRVCAALRVTAALGLAVYVLRLPTASAGRHVESNVESLAQRARPLLATAHRVAALDIGWPTAATEATIVDLAGLTDPEIAALPGGHTSKRIDTALLLERDPDVVLLYARKRGEETTYTRVVEARLADSELLMRKYETRAFLPYGEDGAGYVVLSKRER
jgi:urease accessory protein UreF